MKRRFSHYALALLASTSGLGLSSQALANDASTDAPSVNQDIIVVTGTRQASRTAFNSLAPIDVIGGDDIDGTASEDLLDSVAQTIPSFKVQRLPMNDGLVFVRPATLRGLSPDHTLVLVNGKRRHRSALLGGNGAQSADLATIPSAAIKHIEVLRDGASAQYGSDAIAGVINIILDDEAGYNAFAQYSQYYKGDGENYRVGAQGGWNFNDAGFLTISAEYFDAARTSRSRQRPDAIAFQAANPNIKLADPVQNWGQPERSGYRFAANSRFELSPAVSAYGFATYGEGEGLTDFNWRNPLSGVFNQSTVYPDFNLRDLYPAGFSPQFGQDDKDLSFTAGVEGEMMDGRFTWDLSLGYGANEIAYKLFNTINASMGPNSPTSFKPGTLSQREFNINLDFVYALTLSALADDANIAFGLERRVETYEVEAGDVASYTVGPAAREGLPSGSNGFFGMSPAQSGEFDQESYAGYIDVELPLTDRWTVGLAARYEDYSEFGSTTNGKISTRFEVTPDFALRGTASTGFRAPTPGQLFSERNSQGLDTVTLEVFTRGRFSPEGAVAQIVNERANAKIDPLNSEESTNYTLGGVYRNANGFSFSLDLYRIEIENRFGTSANFTLTAAERARLVDLGVTGGESITAVSFFQNDFDTRTSGLDLVISNDFTLGDGVLTLTGAYNYNKTEVTGGSIKDNESQRVRLEEALPQHSANVSATYALGAFEVMGRVRYYGDWTDLSGNAGGDIFQNFGAKAFVDVSVSYDMTDNATLRMGAENLFDTYPDEATYQANRGLIYSRNAPYDTDGGNVYVRLDVNF